MDERERVEQRHNVPPDQRMARGIQLCTADGGGEATRKLVGETRPLRNTHARFLSRTIASCVFAILLTLCPAEVTAASSTATASGVPRRRSATAAACRCVAVRNGVHQLPRKRTCRRARIDSGRGLAG